MPATAGWVRMPQSNRVAVSASLRTHAIWTESVGYDPYAPAPAAAAAAAGGGNAAAAAAAEDTLKDKAKELLTLARLTGTLSTHTPGACTRCNQVGHLSYQCRNDIRLSDPKETEGLVKQLKLKEEEEDDERLRRALGIGSDDESPRQPVGGIRRKRSRSSSSSSSRSSSSSSSSSSDDDKKKKKKKKSKKHKKDKKKHKKSHKKKRTH